jgi:proteasome lid subunit RPN8/RPN11
MKHMSISMILWYKLIKGLRNRGKGIRESGAFLVGKPELNIVTDVVFYDEFDKTVSQSGIIEFKGAKTFYEYLEKEGLDVKADIHTHPTSNTNQSQSDKTHPMIRLKGHIAIIAPNYAKNYFLLPKHCSVYRYLGDYKWMRFERKNFPIHLKLI